MKRFNKKALLVIMALCVSMFVFTGCNDETEPAPVTDDTPSAEEEAQKIHDYDDIAATFETDDDYFKALETLTNAGKYVKTDLANRMAEIDATDTAKATEVAETVKKPFTQFKAITPPAAYAEANQYYMTAADQFIAYIDAVVAGQDGTAQLEAAQKSINAGSTAATDALVKSSQAE